MVHAPEPLHVTRNVFGMPLQIKILASVAAVVYSGREKGFAAGLSAVLQK